MASWASCNSQTLSPRRTASRIILPPPGGGRERESSTPRTRSSPKTGPPLGSKQSAPGHPVRVRRLPAHGNPGPLVPPRRSWLPCRFACARARARAPPPLLSATASPYHYAYCRRDTFPAARPSFRCSGPLSFREGAGRPASRVLATGRVSVFGGINTPMPTSRRWPVSRAGDSPPRHRRPRGNVLGRG